MEVLVVGDRFLDVAFEPVDGEVHAAESGRFLDLLLAVDRQFVGGIFLMLGDEARALNEHAAGAAGRVQDHSVVRFKDLNEEADDTAGREELAALLSLGHRELTQEILVDAAEGVEVGGDGNLRDLLEQLLEQRAVENLVSLGQDPGQLGVVLLDVAHRVVDVLTHGAALGQGQEVIESGAGREVEDAFGVVGAGVVDLRALAVVGRLLLQLAPQRGEPGLGEAEEDQTKDRLGILLGGQPRVCAKLVGGGPEALLQRVVVVVFRGVAIQIIEVPQSTC